MNEQNNTYNLLVWSDEKLKTSYKTNNINKKTVYKSHV